MKRNRVLVVVLAVLVTTAASTVPAAADPGDSAIAELTYECPFTGVPVEADFLVRESADHLKGEGFARFAIFAGDVPATFEVLPKVVRVAGDEVFFAGPIVNGSMPGMNAGWWYFAARGGSAVSGGGAFGMFISANSKWAFVQEGFLYFGAFQPLLDGWVVVHGS